MTKAEILHVSIRAPRAGGDDLKRDPQGVYALFQSAPPARGAILSRRMCQSFRLVSIRAPARGAITATCTE